VVRASAGDADGAADTVVQLLQMLRIYDDEPVSIVCAVRVACRYLAAATAADVLEVATPSDAALARLQDALLNSERPDGLERMVLAERVFGLATMLEVVRAAGAGDWPSEVPVVAWPAGSIGRSPIVIHMATGYLRDVARLLQDARRPWPALLAGGRAAPALESTMGRILAPSLIGICTNAAKAETCARAAAVATALVRYRRAHGRLPEQLTELVPEFVESVPTDPFTGRELLYRHDGQSVMVYGVGANQADDRGDVYTGTGRDKAPDVGLRVRLRD
jgi:hypothetical protein